MLITETSLFVAKATADKFVKDCKSNPSTKNPKVDCDDKWGCFHAWGVIWCALENDGVSQHS